MVLSMHLTWYPPRSEVPYYEHTAWQHIRISYFLKRVPILISVLSGNVQGLHRIVAGPVSKWDELMHAVAIGDVFVLMVQEAWASSKKPSKRAIGGFWSRMSMHQLRGQGNGIWACGQWCKFQMVIMVEPFALLLLVASAMGMGVIGSVHMAQHKAQTEFQRQIIIISLTLETVPSAWAVIGGDWNRDIREDKHMQVILYRLQMCVVPRVNEVGLPKDVVVLLGVLGPTRSFWLKKVGDHPLVWLQGS